jgi:hypothetical protein
MNRDSSINSGVLTNSLVLPGGPFYVDGKIPEGSAGALRFLRTAAA